MSDRGMAKPDPNLCEVKVDGLWLAVSLAEASTRYVKAEKRCPACNGRVSIAGTYTATGKRVIVHRRTHDGCPLLPSHFSGTLPRHPEAVA